MSVYWRASLAALLLAGVMAFPSPAWAEEAPRTRVVTVELRTRLENKGKADAQNLKLEVPTVVAARAGHQRVLDMTYTVEPTESRETEAGLETTYKVASLKPGSQLDIVQRYKLELSERPAPVEDEFEPQQYLSPEPGVESDDPAIRARAEELVSGLQGADEKAEALVQFVSRHIVYNGRSSARQMGAKAAFTLRGGVCTEYASLFVAMSRAVGVPARVVYGWASMSDLRTLDEKSRHAWAEYYSEGKGWIPVDPTYASVRPLYRAMDFDGLNHVAQDWVQLPMSSVYSGRTLVSMVTTYTLSGGAVATTAGQ